MFKKKSGGKKFSWKKFWSKFRPDRRTESALEGEASLAEENLPCCSRIDFTLGAETSKEVDADVIDIHEIDKDRIRTTCKEALDNPPEFPTREEVKEKIEKAHKYYGVKCIYNRYSDSEGLDDKEKLQPSWYYILERPLVEQYVLMNNYIRKLSVMASLKNEQSGCEEEPVVEEEVSSISSLSDYGDFAPDSKIVAKLKELKKAGALPSQIGASRLEQELMNLKKSAKSKERTLKTNEYTIVIREPTIEDNREGVLPSTSNAIELEEIERRLENEGIDDSDLHSSGDHLPNMSNFDLSQNLVNGPVEVKTGFRLSSYYHWLGNSTPTKTPLLNMDCQPPVRPRAPGTARDFLSFRSLSLSSEFVDSCRNASPILSRDYSVAFAEECRSSYLKDLVGSEDSNDDLDQVCINSATQTEQKDGKPLLSLTWEDPMKNCSSALAADENAIVERAALISDYNRECGAQATGYIGDINCEEKDPAHVLPVPASHALEDEQSSYEVEDHYELGTSVSQMNSDAHITELDSASSMETQIIAKPTNSK